jgi:hypothetical protein
MAVIILNYQTSNGKESISLKLRNSKLIQIRCFLPQILKELILEEFKEKPSKKVHLVVLSLDVGGPPFQRE